MTGPVVQSHGPEGKIIDDAELLGLEQTHELAFGKDHWRAPAIQEMRKESLARSVPMLVREIRSLRRQIAEAKKSP